MLNSSAPGFAGLLLAGSFVVSVLLVRGAMSISRRTRFLALPSPIVPDHKHPVPKGGGMAVMGLVLASCLVLSRTSDLPLRLPLGVLPAFVLGCADDLIEFRPLVKFLLQCLVTVLYLALAPLPHWAILPAAVFLVASQNAWNLVDVLDGLVGGIAAPCFLGLALVFLLAGNLTGLALASVLVAGAFAGFQVWNAYPARVYLGDSGSTPLGMLFGILVLEGTRVEPGLPVPLMLTGLVPFFEVVFLIIVRTRRGIRFYHKSPDHFSHRLRRNGRPAATVVAYVALVGVGLDLLAVLAGWQKDNWVVSALVVLVVAAAWLTAHRFLSGLSPDKEPS